MGINKEGAKKVGGMSDSTISVIIPVYIINEKLLKMTDECLTSFFYNTPNDVELIIVDDGSPEPYDSDVGRTIRLDTNSGYSHATNTGLAAAKGDILVLGNNDLIFPENWLTALLFPLNVGFDVATCWTSDQDNVVLQDRIKPAAKFGSLFAMNRYVYDKIGGFDEQFRGPWSDTDLRRRMLDEDIKIGKNLSAVVTHLARVTEDTVDPNNEGFVRGQRLFEIKWGFAE